MELLRFRLSCGLRMYSDEMIHFLPSVVYLLLGKSHHRPSENKTPKSKNNCLVSDGDNGRKEIKQNNGNGGDDEWDVCFFQWDNIGGLLRRGHLSKSSHEVNTAIFSFVLVPSSLIFLIFPMNTFFAFLKFSKSCFLFTFL